MSDGKKSNLQITPRTYDAVRYLYKNAGNLADFDNDPAFAIEHFVSRLQERIAEFVKDKEILYYSHEIDEFCKHGSLESYREELQEEAERAETKKKNRRKAA